MTCLSPVHGVFEVFGVSEVFGVFEVFGTFEAFEVFEVFRPRKWSWPSLLLVMEKDRAPLRG